jgi:hypothetical protein
LGIEITQSSYIWAAGNAQDLVLLDFEVRNIGRRARKGDSLETKTISDLYVGIQGEARVWRVYDQQDSFGDEIVGYLNKTRSPQRPEVDQNFHIAWMADNDGDPEPGGFGRTSNSNVVGFALLDMPDAVHRPSFNWWDRHPIRSRDWGPTRADSRIQFLHGGTGTPLGDIAKYQMLSNGEIDYPQVKAAQDFSSAGWSPPHPDAAHARDIADGFTPRFLLSFGPMELSYGASIRFTIAICGGLSLHTEPGNFQFNFDPANPEVYLDRLHFENLLSVVQRALWIYDNPGVDTDGDGYAGEYLQVGSDRVYYRGDGVPDFRYSLPPPSPSVRFETRAGRIVVCWNGHRSETEWDLFVQRLDFEGYRVYMSRTGREDEWSFLGQRDLVNYTRYTWDSRRSRWEIKDPPYSLDSLKAIYDALTDSSYGFPFHPDSFPVPTLDRALLEVLFDPANPVQLDSMYRYFGPYEANNQADDLGLAMAVEAGADVTGAIRKLYPQSSPTDTAFREDGTPYLPFYEYEYIVKDLQVAEPVFLAVTAFDHGDPASGLEPFESSKAITAQEVWAINSAAVVKSERPKPGVYPNPYRILDGYYDNHWENRLGIELDRERARQVTFYNVPDTCVLSIWSLDGDLVRKIHHASNPSGSEATVVRWNLITRNTQAVKTGIYVWSVESRFGTDVGKLVIIK